MSGIFNPGIFNNTGFNVGDAGIAVAPPAGGGGPGGRRRRRKRYLLPDGRIALAFPEEILQFFAQVERIVEPEEFKALEREFRPLTGKKEEVNFPIYVPRLNFEPPQTRFMLVDFNTAMKSYLEGVKRRHKRKLDEEFFILYDA